MLNQFMFHFYDRLSVNKKILFAGSCALLLAVVVIIFFAAITTYNSSAEVSQQSLDNMAKYQTERVYATLNSVMTSAETFSSVLAGQHRSETPLPRDQLSPMLVQILEDNPNFYAIYTMWEENAYDGLDSQYSNIDPYSKSGRVNIYVARDDDGNPQAMVDEEEYDDLAEDYTSDYYVIPKETKQLLLADPYLETYLDPPVLMTSVSAPILENGIFKGIIGIDLAIDVLDQIADDIDLREGKETMILVSHDGTIVAISGESDLIGEPLEELAPVFGVSADEIMTQFLQENDAVFKIGKYIGVTNPVIIGDPEKYWSVIIIIPESVLLEKAFALTLSLTITGVIISICGLFLLSMVANSITQPIKNLTIVAQAVAGGDLSKRVNSDGFDEVAELGMAFDHMTSELEMTLDTIRKGKEEQNAVLKEIGVITRAASEGKLNVRGDALQFLDDNQDVIKSINATLDALVGPLSEAMRMTSSFASGNFSARFNEDIRVSGDFIPFKNSMDTIGIQLGEAIGNVRNQMTSLKNEMNQTNIGVSEISSTTHELSIGMSKISQQAELSRDEVQEIQNYVDIIADNRGKINYEIEEFANLIDLSRNTSDKGLAASALTENGMRAIFESHAMSQEIIRDLEKEMKAITGIIAMIARVADQTSVLALNAAIQAVRAGSAGDGFAVVANEVKGLATESHIAAQEIEEKIQNLSNMTGIMTDSIKSSAEKIADGNKAVTETITLFTDLAGVINDMDRKIESVTTSGTEQNIAIDQVRDAIGVLNTSFVETTEEAVNMAAFTEEAASALDSVATSVQEITISAEKISERMEWFSI
jgi:methyl-accepting chemotaxis protein